MASFSFKRVGKIIGVIVLIAGIAGGIYLGSTARQAKIFYANLFQDSRQHYLPCQNMPFYIEAQKAMEKHQDILDKLKQLGALDVSAKETKCYSADSTFFFMKGDIEISYHTHQQRLAIEKLIGDNFFGIPWRGYRK